MTSQTDALGNAPSYAYDAAGQLSGVDYSDPDTADVALSYDAGGRRTAMTDGVGTTSLAHDSLDRLTGHTNGRGTAWRMARTAAL